MNDIPFLDRFGDAMESAIKYGPAQRTWSRVRAWMTLRAGAATAVAAALAVLFVVISPFAGPPPSVFAGWTPAPGTVDPEVAAVAADNCGFPASIQTNPDGSQQPVVWPPPAIVDQRGKAAAALLVGDGTIAFCFLTDDGRGWGQGHDGLGSARSAARAGELRAFSAPLTVDGLVGSRISGPRATAGRTFLNDGVPVIQFSGPGAEVTGVAGRISAEVSNIEVRSEAGPTVKAAIADGFFFAWWPQETDLMTMTVVGYDEGGSEVARWSASG
jgi:hypothetical protein